MIKALTVEIYPQWFIGGPWQGKDLYAVTGHYQPIPQDAVQVAEYDPPLEVVPLADESLTTLHVRTYRRRRYQFGPVPLTVWVVDGMSDTEAIGQLMAILLKPHGRKVDL